MRISDWSSDVCSSDLALAGCQLHFKCENLQRIGAFKFRGACNAVFSLDMAAAARGVVTQSSGNHGAAIALACRLRDIPAHIVVPEDAPQAKVDAMRLHGAHLHRSEEHTSELQSLMRISYAVFCLKKKKHTRITNINHMKYTQPH